MSVSGTVAGSIRSVTRTCASRRAIESAALRASLRTLHDRKPCFSYSQTSRTKFVQAKCSNRSFSRSQSTNAFHGPELFTEAKPGRTALYDLHIQHGAKMVPFGGYSMPVQYSDLSVGESHAWTREKASLFDVGHMVQYNFQGEGAEAFLESLTPVGLKELLPGQSSLSTLLHPRTGGIVDDCIITRRSGSPEQFYVVLNAGCRDKDYEFLSKALDQWTGATVQINHVSESGQPNGLIAIQGPLSAAILESVLHPSHGVDVKTWYFGNSKEITVKLSSGESLPIIASRGGYTGEDGFELSIHPSQTVEVTKLLLDTAGPAQLRLAGLGARDSLRLEAGMCLYGHDLDDTTTPVEAALSWIIPKSRRSKATATFNGAEAIIPQLTPISKGGAGVSRRRIGLVVEGSPAREGAEIVDGEGNTVGCVTSGCPSPTLKKNIAMGYIKDGMHKSGTEVGVVVRGKRRKAVVAKMPFVPSKYAKAALSPA